MPRYNVKGTTYNIPEDKAEKFERRYPDATVEIYDGEGTGYRLPLSKRDAFQKKYSGWSYEKDGAPAKSGNDGEWFGDSIGVSNVSSLSAPMSPEAGGEPAGAAGKAATDVAAAEAGAPVEAQSPADGIAAEKPAVESEKEKPAAPKGDPNGWPKGAKDRALAEASQLGESVRDAMAAIGKGTKNLKRAHDRYFTPEGRKRAQAAEMSARMKGLQTRLPGMMPTPPADTVPTTNKPDDEGGVAMTISPTVYDTVIDETGEEQVRWMLPDGSLTTDFIEADQAEAEARKGRLQKMFTDRMSMNGLDPSKPEDVAVQTAMDRLPRVAESLNKEIEKDFNERYAPKKDEGFFAHFLRVLGRNPNTQTGTLAQDVSGYNNSLRSEEYNRLQAEQRTLEKTIEGYVARHMKKGDGFWDMQNVKNFGRGLWDVVKDADTYAGGTIEFQRMSQLMAIRNKIDAGGELSENDFSLLEAVMGQQAVESSGSAAHGYTAGKITGEMVPFMIQMAMNPASNLGKSFAKMAVRKYGRKATEKMLYRIATRAVGKKRAAALIKGGATTAGDIAASAVLANTLQAPTTLGDAMQRNLGEVRIEGDGQIKFVGGESVGASLAKAEGAAIIEDYTEMLGAHFGTIGKGAARGVAKAARKLGGGRIVDGVSTLATRISATDWAKAIGNIESKAEWHGTLGEVLEEEAGIVLNSMFVGDNKISDLVDAEQQIDIVLGVGLFGGFVSGIKTAGYPIARHKAQKNLRQQENVGRWRFQEDWKDIAAAIDGADEKSMGKTVHDLVRQYAKSDQQGQAIVQYAHALMRARGYNMARESVREDGTLQSRRHEQIEDMYDAGYDATWVRDRNAIEAMYEHRRQHLVTAMAGAGVENVDEYMASVDADPIGAIENEHDPVLQREVLDYVNAKIARDGMLQRVRDDIDSRIAQSDAEIDARVNRQTGMVQPLMLKDDSMVYVVSGKVAANDDGTPDMDKSSDTLIVCDSRNGSMRMTSPRFITKVGVATDATEQKRVTAEQIRKVEAEKAMAQINGTLTFNPGEKVQIDTGGGIVEATISGDAVDAQGNAVPGQVAVQLADGSSVTYAKDKLQEMSDAARRKQAEEYDREKEKPRGEGGQRKFALNDEFTILDEAGNQVGGTIIGEVNEDGMLEIETEKPINGNTVSLIKPEELEEMLFSYNGENVTAGEGEGAQATATPGAPGATVPGAPTATAENNAAGGNTAGNSVPLQGNNGIANGNGSEQDNDGPGRPSGTDGGSVAGDSAGSLASNRDRSDIRVYEKGLGSEPNEHTQHSERDRREAESERLVEIAKANGQYRTREDISSFGKRTNKRSGESEVYDNHEVDGRIYKVKNPYAKSPLKGHVQPEDAIYEHLVHNKYFPETSYRFEGISDEGGDVRIVLSQGYVESVGQPTKEQIEAALAERGLKPEGQYRYGNEEISVTDVTGDNALLGADGKVYFIDPIIDFKKPVREILGENNTEGAPVSALAQVPMHQEQTLNDKGKPMIDRAGNPVMHTVYDWTSVDPEVAWDALVEKFQGDEIAQNFATMMVGRTQKALDAAKKEKSLETDDADAFAISEAERLGKIQRAQEELNKWKTIAGTSQRRAAAAAAQQAAEKAAKQAAQAAQVAAQAAAQQAAAQQSEGQNDVPDWHMDNPENARKRGQRRANGQLYTRQEPVQGVQGKEVEVKFSQTELPKGRVMVIEASQLQPSHLQGQRNPMFFIDEAQPKNRAEGVSSMAAREIADKIRPEEITGHVTAYTGAPTVNSRGEVIQGNNRSDALRVLWENNMPEQQQRYKQYLIDNAAQFGIDPEAVRGMKHPVLVNMVDVEDAEAIRLGQMTAQDTESGGIERIKPKNVAQKLGGEISGFANLLLNSSDEDATFGQLVDRNGVDVLKWLAEKGVISDTQYQSAFDSKGNITAEAKNDLQKVLYQSIFRGGSQQLEEMFDRLPAKAQRALLGTAFRDMESPDAGKMLPEIQASVAAYNILMNDPYFANAKNTAEALKAVEGFKRQTALNDRFEQYVPADNFSNFALHLAAMYKGSTQKTITETFSRMYDLAQGKGEGDEKTPTYKRTITIDGKHTVIQVDEPDGNGFYTGSRFEYQGEQFGSLTEVIEVIDKHTQLAANIAEAEAEVNTDPTPGQKEAGNYKKGHVQVGTFDVTIEQPVGSVRRGTDADGKEWETTMQNAYGYIRGTQGVDGDHIDVFLSTDIDAWNGRRVIIVDQYNPDGSFDEHKVMLGFNDKADAINAYLANYEKGWEKGRRLVFSTATLEDFEKWIESSHRKQKPYHEYKIAEKAEVEESTPENPVSETEQERDPLFDEVRQWLGMKGLAADDSSRNAVMRYFKIGYVRAGKILNAIAEANAPQATTEEAEQEAQADNTTSAYTITPTKYEGKHKTSDVWLVKFNRELTAEEKAAFDTFVRGQLTEGKKTSRGWYDRKQGGYMMRSEEAARQLGEMLGNEEAVADAQPLSLEDMRPTSGTGMAQVDVEGLLTQLSETGEANLADHSTPVEPAAEEKPEEKPVNPSGNKLVTDEQYADYLARFKKKIGGQLNMGVDPEILQLGAMMAVYHIEKGARKFVAYVKAMYADLADMADKVPVQYLKGFYKNAHNILEVNAPEIAEELDSDEVVNKTDVAAIINGHTDAMAAAEAVVAEQEAEDEKAEAERKLQAYRHLVNKYAQDIANDMMFKKAVSLMDTVNVQAIGSELYNTLVGNDIATIATNDIYKMFVDQWNINNGTLQSAIIAEAIRKAHKAIRDERTTVNPDGTTSQTVVEAGTEIEITSGDFIPGVRPTVNTEKKPGGKKKPSKPKPEPTTDGGLFDTVEDEPTSAPSITVPEPRPAVDLMGDSSAYQDRGAQTAELVEEIGGVIESRVMMLQLDAESVKPLTMTEVKKMASKYTALKDISDTDLQELVELAMTQLTRSEAIINIDGTAEQQRAAFDHIVNLYQIQPSLNARDSERLIKQQYSTPTPFGYVMGQFVRAGGKTVGSMLEPSAGNGALTITVHPSLVHVNDIDEARLANLRKLGYAQVTAQDALLPFEGDKVDVVMTNPPFGTVTEKVYDGIFHISSLEAQMAINALEKMKDDGRAAIVIGGNTSYRTNGSMNPKDAAFFGYLYSHYNVADVINISGKALYSRNGTGYDVRMILIDGRKTGEFQRVYPPVKAKARAEQVTTFDELYKRVQDDIQQIQQMGSQSADVQRDPETAADGTASAPVRSGNNRPNTGAGQRPGTTGDAVRDTPRTDSGQPTPANDGGRPVGVDNAVSGDAGSSDNVPRPAPQQPRSVGSGSSQNGTRRSGSDGRGAATSRPDRGAERLAVKPDLTTEKVPYPNQSGNGFTLMSVVPAAQAQVLQKSLGEIGDVDQYLVDELGYSSKEELYSYLAAEQIDSVALAIHQMNKGNAFIIGDMTGVGKGRQGAALIRYAVMQGKVPIYFTQKPTLYTDNYRDLCDIGSSNLRPFIIASNAKDANIVDADGNVVHKLPSKKEQERVFNYIMEHGTLPDEYDYVLTTYDQIKNGTADYEQNEDGTWNTVARKLPKKSKGYTTADANGQTRRDALARLAEGNITILDESHTVGGDSGCGRYMQMLTSQAGGVTFLSATFAKRADNMPIYAQRTAIAEAGVKASELIDAIMKGGVTLQEIMSKQLVESGQMIRRERSFEGVTIDWLSVAEETDRRQRQQFNEVAEIFNAIRNFQDDYITPIIDAKNEEAAEYGATVGHTQGTKDMGVKNVPFASKMYNLVNQLLFALKVDAVADRVVENLRNGYKPVISFTNTMERFLSSAPKGVAMDDVPNFSLTLMRALDGVMRFTEKDADENSEGGSISLSELSTEGQNAYNAIREKIMNLSADLPISPMDAIRMRIEEAGYSVAEITGRTMQLNRTDDGRYIVEARKDRDKKAAMRDFNSGKLDVLMINKSCSTGISLHASSKFEDQRPRVMVFAQFQSDINDEVQMRGRIDRSGQVTRGRYEYIMSTIPAEQRIQMMFKAKLKSLDANTTSSQKSKFNEMEIVDYLNKYGDEVVWEYMKEHPELEERLGDPLDMLQEKNSEDGPRTSEKEDTSKKTGCAGKISRYLAFLSVDEQDEIFREITEAYRVKIQLLDDAGENDLEITTMPLRAETKRKQIWHEGVNPGSGNAFADNTYVEEVEVDVLKKPMKRDEIIEATRKLVGEQGIVTEYDQMRYGSKEGEVNWTRYARKKEAEISQFFQAKADEAVVKLREAGEARIAKAREKAVAAATKARGRGENNFTDDEIQSLADTVANEEREKEERKQDKRHSEIMSVKFRIQTLLNRLRAGSIYVVPQDLKQGTPEMFSQTFGTFVGFKFNKSYTLGSSTAIFATLDGRRKVELALSDPAINTIISATEMAYRYSPKEINAITMENWDSNVPTQTRQKRYIITGNLLQALVDTDKGEKTRGNLISYSTIDGETRQGILMGENFKLTDLRNSVPLSSRLAQIREGKAVVSENGDVQISKEIYDWRHRGEYELRVPKSKLRGGIYTMHPGLLKLVEGQNFITKGNNMVAYVTEDNIANVVDMLSRAPFNLTVLQESQLSDVSENEAEDDVLCRPVTDKATLDRLNSEPTIKVYRAMQMIDGGLRPPMSAKVGGELRPATEIGVWEEAEEHPEMADENGYFKLDKGNGKSIKAAYNPYIHTSRSPINDQFSSAWSRPNLVTVEVEIPASELTSGYHAEKAKNSTGESDWKSGPISRLLAKIGQARKVILSRWAKVVRIVPVDEVADAYAQRLKAHGIEVPFNTVPPSLREALAKRGVKIGKPEKGNAGAASMPAFEQWLEEQELQRQGEANGGSVDGNTTPDKTPRTSVFRETVGKVKDNIEDLFKKAVSGKFTGKPVSIGELTIAGREYLERISGLTIKPRVSFMLNPSDLGHIHSRHFGANEKDGRNIPLNIEDIRNIADVITDPDRILFSKEGKGEKRNMFFFLKGTKNGTYQLLEIYADRHGNLSSKSYFKSKEDVSQRVISLAETLHSTPEAIGAILNDGTKVPKMFDNPTITDAESSLTIGELDTEYRQGDGYGAYSDEEVSFANDLKSRVMGRNRFSKKQQAAFAARERERMVRRVNELAARLHLDNVEVVTDVSQLEGKKRTAKGFFNRRTGKITIVLPNNSGMVDVEQTLLHEAVAHYGLRKLFGKHFNTFLDNVYESSAKEIRDKIADMARKNGWDFRTATEEYLAGLAEDTDFETAQGFAGWWSNVKRLFLDMLEKIGFVGFRDKTGVVLTDNELRYLLWSSYENLKNPGRYKSILGEAEDVVKQSDLKVGNYAEHGIEAEYVAEGEDLFRPGDFSPRDQVTARKEYERMVSSGAYQFQEAVQDSMLGLKKLYQAVLGKNTWIEDVAGYENAYLYENRMSSMNAGEQHEYFREYMKPLLEEISKIAGADKQKRKDLTDYIMAKHGLERNEYMRNEAAANDEETERDFAGLIGLTGEADWQSAEATARQWVWKRREM